MKRFFAFFKKSSQKTFITLRNRSREFCANSTKSRANYALEFCDSQRKCFLREAKKTVISYFVNSHIPNKMAIIGQIKHVELRRGAPRLREASVYKHQQLHITKRLCFIAANHRFCECVSKIVMFCTARRGAKRFARNLVESVRTLCPLPRS